MDDDVETIYVGGETLKRLRFIAKELHRSVDDLCDSSISEAALHYFRGRREDDPARD
jgi:hypothetical protein